MFSIRLYHFDKRTNSTKQPPSGDGTVFTCSMKSPSSIYSPVIDIKIGDTSIADYNYAYIANLKRYYFITNSVYNMGVWSLYLAVDLLASFRQDIRLSTQYVLRSASMCDPNIIDTMYMTKRDLVFIEQNYWRSDPITTAGRYDSSSDSWGPSTPFNKQVNDGYYCVGVVGSTNTGVSYYMMSSSVFTVFLNKAFSLTPSNMTDLESGTAAALFNITQYITSCTWYPISPITSNVGTTVTSVTIGSQSINLGYSCILMNGTAIEKFRITESLNNHPQYDSTTTRYLNMSPYTEYGLYFQPFGTIPIDTTKTDGVLSVYWYVDYCQGIATLEMHNGTDEDDPLIYTTTAEYGVPIPVSTLTYDWKGALAIGAANWIKTGISNAAASSYTTHTSSSGETHGGRGGSFGGSAVENHASSIAEEISSAIGSTSRALVDNGAINALNKAIDIAGATFGQVHTVGAQGSFLAYNMDLPYFFAWYTYITDEDPARFGRPLYKQMGLLALSGYCLCANASVSYTHANPLSIERRDVEAMLNSGVFLE